MSYVLSINTGECPFALVSQASFTIEAWRAPSENVYLEYLDGSTKWKAKVVKEIEAAIVQGEVCHNNLWHSSGGSLCVLGSAVFPGARVSVPRLMRF